MHLFLFLVDFCVSEYVGEVDAGVVPGGIVQGVGAGKQGCGKVWGEKWVVEN